MERKRILVVDDDELFRGALKHHLQRNGFRVFSAKNGQEALDILNAVSLHLCIFDYMLPCTTGAQLCMTAKSLIPNLKVILYSGSIDPRDALAGKVSGADSFLLKTGKIAQLNITIERLLSK